MSQAQIIKNNIHRLLEEKGWRISQLENKLGHTRAVTNILRGASKNPTIDVLQSIAKAFNIEIQDLLLDIDSISDTSSDLKLLRNVCQKVIDQLESTDSSNTLKSAQVLSIIKEIYDYSVQLELSEVDENYLKFAVQKLSD